MCSPIVRVNKNFYLFLQRTKTNRISWIFFIAHPSNKSVVFNTDKYNIMHRVTADVNYAPLCNIGKITNQIAKIFNVGVAYA
jgi:hypothetical protein